MEYAITRSIYLVILITGVIIGFCRWKRNPPAFKLLAVLIATVFIFDGGGIIYRLFYTTDISVLVYRLFAPAEITVYTAIFLCLYKRKKFVWPTIIASFIIMVYITVYDITRSHNDQLDTLPILIKCYYYILLSLVIFQEYMFFPNENDILKEQTFWFISAILFVNTMVIMYWSCFMLMQSPGTLGAGRLIMVISNYIYYAVLGYTLYLPPAEPQKSMR